MKYNEDLINIVRENEFKTFWHCLDFLNLAGFPVIDSFSISMQEFGESKIYEHLAFIRVVERGKIMNINSYDRTSGELVAIVGLIDDTNIHLSGLYRTYRDWLVKDKLNIYPDVEDTCEVIEVFGLNPIMLDYLIDASERHFGFKAFSYPKLEDFLPTRGMADRYRISALDDLRPEIEKLRNMVALPITPPEPRNFRLEDLQRGINRNNETDRERH